MPQWCLPEASITCSQYAIIYFLKNVQKISIILPNMGPINYLICSVCLYNCFFRLLCINSVLKPMDKTNGFKQDF
jgi:hypothetical protein